MLSGVSLGTNRERLGDKFFFLVRTFVGKHPLQHLESHMYCKPVDCSYAFALCFRDEIKGVQG